MEETVEEVFEGGCQCGAVAYRLSGKSLTLFACHCGDCQKQSSSAFGMALWVGLTQVELLSGRLQARTRRTPGGREMVCEFCPECGSRLFHRTAGRDDIISIKPGSLNGVRWLRPVATYEAPANRTGRPRLSRVSGQSARLRRNVCRLGGTAGAAGARESLRKQ